MATFLLFSLFPVLAGAADPPARPLVVFDLAPALEKLDPKDPVALRRHYDEVLLATCLQGLVNRNEPRLFIQYNARNDDFWFEKMPEPGGWMAGLKVERATSLQDLTDKFLDSFKGLVVWDERVPATSNVAATVAGVENLLPIRFDEHEGSLYRELTVGDAPLKIVRRLLADDGGPLFTGKGDIPGTDRQSTGSAKNDTYIWLLENFIKPGKTNKSMLGYYIDGFWLKCWQASSLENHTLNNFDFLVANRGAILDLNVLITHVFPATRGAVGIRLLNASPLATDACITWGEKFQSVDLSDLEGTPVPRNWRHAGKSRHKWAYNFRPWEIATSRVS